MSHFSNQKWCGLWLCAWRLSFISFWGNSRKSKSSRSVFWSPPPVGKCEDDSVELKALLPSPTCSHCSHFSVISNYLSCNQLAMVMRKHAEHDGGSWFSFFFIFATINMMDLSSRTWGLILKIQQEPGLQIGIGEALDRSQSLFYFVTQKFQCQAGSSRRHQTKN